MFQRLKTKNQRTSIFENRPNAMSISKIPSATSTSVKGNEKDRFGRCKHCGWICDRERDVRLPDGNYAGFGINQGTQLTMGTSVGDAKTPAAGAVSGSAQQYYDRSMLAGCPSCGSYTWDPRQKVQPYPTD